MRNGRPGNVDQQFKSAFRAGVHPAAEHAALAIEPETPHLHGQHRETQHAAARRIRVKGMHQAEAAPVRRVTADALAVVEKIAASAQDRPPRVHLERCHLNCMEIL